ncbi:transcription factor grauzone-like [Anopheles ziemanni]|uniref:transcription factor grauzone-like n=1 Tax=Anopheles ziemanni TaxID=345580 RepID=UPI00265DE8A5|nr:transcription factor grauzone-like [Anopheles ziemanni]
MIESEYKEIFVAENKHIVAIIAQHLWFEITETPGCKFICTKCWVCLNDFHEFYERVEELRRVEHFTIENKKLDESTDTTDLKYRPEFLEVKVEPIEVNVEATDDTVVSGEKSVSYTFIKCEETEEHDPTALSSEDDEQLSPKSSSSSECWSQRRKGKPRERKLPKPDEADEETKKEVKAAAQKEEDTGLLQFYKRVVCEVCDNHRMMVGEPQIDYGTWRALLRHTKEVHSHDKIYVKCPLCDLKLRTKQALLQHKEMHENPEKYRCELCGEIHQNMKDHMQNKHQERQFCCDVCGKKFPFKKRLTVHMKKMHVEKDIICDQCQKPFTKYTIEDHKRSVHTARFVCEHCPKTFNSRFRLKQHMEEHDESLRNSTAVPCTICGQVMRDKYILTRHIKLMHTVQPSVSCSTCGKTFKCKRNLWVHMKNVCMEPTRLYPCTICGKQFRRKNKLKEHMSTHTGKPLYMCSFCPETFRQDTHLYYHRKNAHYEQWLEMQQQRKEGVRFKLTELISPSLDNQKVCTKCWCSLESFHIFYQEIEQLHHQQQQQQQRPASRSNGKARSVSPAPLQGPPYKTEFLEIKGEPLEDEEDEARAVDAIDEEFDEKAESNETIKSEDSDEFERDSSPSDDDVKRRSKKLTTGARSRKAYKKDRSDTTLKKRKAAGRVSVHPDEDKAILHFYKRIVCEVCDNQRMIVGEPVMEFLTWGALLRHTKEVHGHYKIFVQCPVCEMKLRTKVTLWQHMDMHTNPDKYRCEVCAEIHQNMKEHMQNKHEERQFSCDLCGSKFPFKKRLVVHMKKMHAEKDVPCDQCDKSFTKYTIEDHRRSVHMARFVCEHCPKTFKIRFRLQKHMQEHDKSLRTSTSVPCPTCGQVMGDKYILRQHIRHMHAERQAVDCETCGKTFKNKRNLSVHLANVCMKPAQLHACSICDKQFRHKNKLKDHMSCCVPN